MSSPLRVAIPLLHHQHYVGTGGYCARLLEALAEFPADDLSPLLLGTSRSIPPKSKLPGQAVRPFWFRSPFGLRSDHWPGLFRGCSLVHYPTCVGPPLPDRPLVVTLHDVSPFVRPDCYPALRGVYLRQVFRRLLDAARLIMTVSDWQKSVVAEFFPAAKDRLRGVVQPVSPEFSGGGDDAASLPVGLQDKGYFLCVATLEPRKNHRALFQSWKDSQLLQDLCLVGEPGWRYQRFLRELYRQSQRVEHREMNTIYHLPDGRRLVHLRRLSIKQLRTLYHGAAALVYPSLFEGFGLPVLEAMTCGCPVVTSRNSPMEEVAGTAGWYCDPQQQASIAAAMRALVENAPEAKRRAQVGLERAAAYSLQKMAESHQAVYREALSRSS